jgi:C1A family cysteine protease
VLLVGHGVENGVAYWIFKNSWGTQYGEMGFVRIGMQENYIGYCGNQFYGWEIEMVKQTPPPVVEEVVQEEPEP